MAKGGNLAAGALIVLAILILNAFVAYLASGAIPATPSSACNSNGNTTTCGSGSPQSFLDTFFDVAVSGFSGVAAIDGLYVFVVVGFLVVGFALIVAGIIGTPLGGG